MKLKYSNVKGDIRGEVEVEGCTIKAVREAISKEINCEYENLTIIYKGYKLHDDTMLSELDINESTVFLILIKQEKKEVVKEEKEVRKEQNDCDPNDVFETYIQKKFIKMFTESDKFKQMIEKRPELAELVENPQDAKRFFNSMFDPTLMKYSMRRTDIELSKLDNTPNGFKSIMRLNNIIDELDEKRTNPIKYNESMTNEDFQLDEPITEPYNMFASRKKTNKLHPYHPIRSYKYREIKRMERPLLSISGQDRLRSKFSKELEILKEKGFINEKDNIEALNNSNGDIDQAINTLTKHMK